MLHVEPLRAGKEKIWTHISCSSNTAADTQKIVVPMCGKSVKWPRIRTRHSGPAYFGTGSPRLTWLVLEGVAVRGCSAAEAEQRRNLLRLWSQQARALLLLLLLKKKRPTHWSAARGGFSGPIFFLRPRKDEKWTKRTPCVWIILGFYLNCYSSHTLDNCILQIVIYLSINHVIMKFLWSFNK